MVTLPNRRWGRWANSNLVWCCICVSAQVACHRQAERDRHDQSLDVVGSKSFEFLKSVPPGLPAAVVDLAGNTKVQTEAIDASSPRVFAKVMQTWIYSEPRQDSGKLGYLRLGSSAAINAKPVRGASCPGGWYSLVPRGFVCLDASSTTDGNDPIVRAMRNLGPVIDRKLPYIYGMVRRPGPVYRRIPTRDDLTTAEPDLARRMDRWLSAPGEFGAGYAQKVWVPPGAPMPDPKESWLSRQSEQIPEFLQSGKFAPRVSGDTAQSITAPVLGTMAPRVGYSILQTVLSGGRRYGISAKFEVIATDRLRPIQGSDFHGFRIPEDINFPFAIVREPGAMLFSYDSASKKTNPTQRAPYRAAIKLTGKQAFFRGKLFYETADGLWLSDRDASRLDPVRKMPAWGTNGEKWIDINVTKQTLALYEGTKAVYATLVSTGEAGLSDPDKSTATKRGIYRIHTKHISVTMDSDEVGEEYELRDVPYVQYFESGYALHGAYWHDRFGIPKSHGCINLAPEDARRIFFLD